MESCENLPVRAKFLILGIIARWLLDLHAAARRDPATYLYRLPRDIHRYVLEPMLWEGDTLHGVRHRAGYLYDVKHDPTGRIHATASERVYYAWGEVHRDDGPAIMSPHGCKFYRHGRLADGLRYVGSAGSLTYQSACGREYTVTSSPMIVLHPARLVNGKIKRGTIVIRDNPAQGVEITFAHTVKSVFIYPASGFMYIGTSRIPFFGSAGLLAWVAPLLLPNYAAFAAIEDAAARQ